MAVVRDRRLICLAASMPFMIGIPMSKITMSGSSLAAFSTASEPSHASPMMFDDEPSISRTFQRHAAKSSTTRILLLLVLISVSLLVNADEGELGGKRISISLDG